jgi:hypothetical protein
MLVSNILHTPTGRVWCSSLTTKQDIPVECRQCWGSSTWYLARLVVPLKFEGVCAVFENRRLRRLRRLRSLCRLCRVRRVRRVRGQAKQFEEQLGQAITTYHPPWVTNENGQ